MDELVEIVLETVRRNHYREDVYIRPSFYKSTKAIGVRLHHLDHELYVITSPFGNYIDIEKGVRVMTSTWRRNADEALPARGKIVGGYVNMAFQKSEAELNGFDEALVMTPDGHASEASAANLFMVRDGVLITPPVSDDILEGVTRKAILTLASDLGIPTEVRSVDRSELYVCDEVFLCGTGVQVSPVIELDHRAVGTGAIGPVSRLVSERYFAAVRGNDPAYRELAHRDRGVAPAGTGRAAAPGARPASGGRQPTASTTLSGASLPSVTMKSTVTPGSVTGDHGRAVQVLEVLHGLGHRRLGAVVDLDPRLGERLRDALVGRRCLEPVVGEVLGGPVREARAPGRVVRPRRAAASAPRRSRWAASSGLTENASLTALRIRTTLGVMM